MQDLISIESAPAKLAINYEELKAHLQQELARYEVVVTVDTVAAAKKLATELNQTAGTIDRIRKEEVAKVSGPIKCFDTQMKELVGLCKDGRKKILDQVERFEDKTRAAVVVLLEERRAQLWEEHAVEREFRNAACEDLVLLTSLTAKGNLARAASDKLESRVRDDKALQDRTRMRLVELENQSFRAGLTAPLTRDHVQPFLFADEERYADELQRILFVEVQRQEKAEQLLRERIERERRQVEERELAERARKAREAEQDVPHAEAKKEMDEALAAQSAERAQVEPAETPFDDEEPFEAQPTPAPSTYKATNGRTEWVVTAVFETSVPNGVSRNEIATELHRVMAKAGITTLRSVDVARKTQSSAA